ncbi:aminoglycoside phosphotransferase family protein [Kitasatospora sp. NBC_01250]|uniref:phosphotransferase family protein n=1 Tax=Kitasatospora sp. NBC_01250 TaxID=2903571 RepID=UPI002E2FCD1B|nr:phosphotransferase [Kitasatospora sp. NBC_01250]
MSGREQIRGVPTPEQLAGVARAALGARRRLVGVARLRGGTKKGVYRLTFDDDSTAILYSWHEAENYWPTAPADAAQDHADPFSAASGLDLFQAAHRRLAALGIRTPRLHWADRSGAHYPADLAVVEDVPGENLETLLDRDPRRAAATLEQLAALLNVLRSSTAPHFGKVALIDGGGHSRGESCEGIVLDRALDDLAEAASRDPRLADARARLEERLRILAARVRPRAEYALVHGELGPDHVLVDRFGQPVLIDIEGLMFFDAEWEHAFLRIRFGSHHQRLDPGGLDEQRLECYLLAMRLSLVAGPLRLLDGDFPDRDFMRGIAEHNLQQALAFLRDG